MDHPRTWLGYEGIQSLENSWCLCAPKHVYLHDSSFYWSRLRLTGSKSECRCIDRAWRKLDWGQHCLVPKQCCQLGVCITGWSAIYPLQLIPDSLHAVTPPTYPLFGFCSCSVTSCTLNPCHVGIKTVVLVHMASVACSATDWCYCFVRMRDFPCSHGPSFLFFFYVRCSTLSLAADTSFYWWDCSPLTRASSITTASPSLLICSAHHGAFGRCSQKAIGRE